MHAAITRAPLMIVILVAATAIGLAFGLAPIEPSIMPVPSCPPQC